MFCFERGAAFQKSRVGQKKSRREDAADRIRGGSATGDLARLDSERLISFGVLPGVVALANSRSTPGYYRPPFQGSQFAASPTVGDCPPMVENDERWLQLGGGNVRRHSSF